MGDPERRWLLLSLVRAGCLLVRTRTGRLVGLGWGEASTFTPALSAFSLPSPFQILCFGQDDNLEDGAM